MAMTEVIPRSDLFQVADGPEQTVLTVTGECDVTTQSQLRAALKRTVTQPTHLVILDLSRLTFLDSAGIHALVDSQWMLLVAGKLLVLACPQPIVARVLALTGADQLIRVVGTVGEAKMPVTDAQFRGGPER
jgi:anti-sigma B factor antagonist